MKLNKMPGYRAIRCQLLRDLFAEAVGLEWWDIHPDSSSDEPADRSKQASGDSPSTENEPSMATKRNFLHALGFRAPIISTDWNPRLGGRFEFPIVGARKIEDPWRELWERVESTHFGNRYTYCTGDCVQHGALMLEIAFYDRECLTPIGVVARDAAGNMSLIRGGEVNWDPALIGKVIQFRLAGLTLDSKAKKRIAASLPASVILAHPELFERLRAGSGIDGLYLGYSIGPTQQIEDSNVTPAVSQRSVGFCVAETSGKKRVRFVEAESSAEALRLARLFWALDDSSWIFGKMFEREPNAAWEAILPGLTATQVCDQSHNILQAGSTVAVISDSFRIFGDITASLGAYYIPADESPLHGEEDGLPELFDFCLILGGKKTDERFLLRLEFAQMQALLRDFTLEGILAIDPKKIAILNMLHRYPRWSHRTFCCGGVCGDRRFHYGDLSDNNPFVAVMVESEEVLVDQPSRFEPEPGIAMTWGLRPSSGAEPSEVIVVEQGGTSWFYLTPTTHRFSRSPRTWVNAALELAKKRVASAAV